MGTAWPDVPQLLWPAVRQTLQMVAIVMVLVVSLGGTLGVFLFNSSPRGLHPHPALHAAVGWFANLGRSLPFLVLMASLMPITRAVVGTTIGMTAAIIPMTIAGTAFFARVTDNALREVATELMDVGLAIGGSPWQIVRAIQLREALPALVAGVTLNTIAMIDYSAIAGTIGAGGVGYLAVNYGYQQFDNNVMLACIGVLIVLVQSVQLVGDRVARRLRH